MHHPYEQRTADWWAVRKGKVTGSLAAACLGLDPHRGPFYAYQEIVGAHKTVERYDHWAADREAEARESFERETGLPIQLCGFHTHPDHPWLGASPDGLVGVSAVIEIKNPKKGIPTAIPIHHRIQVLMEMACTGRTVGFYYSFEPGNSRLWVVRPAGTDGLIARLKRFYDQFVVPRIPPPRRVPGRRKRQKPDPVPALNTEYPFGGDYDAPG